MYDYKHNDRPLPVRSTAKERYSETPPPYLLNIGVNANTSWYVCIELSKAGLKILEQGKVYELCKRIKQGDIPSTALSEIYRIEETEPRWYVASYIVSELFEKLEYSCEIETIWSLALKDYQKIVEMYVNRQLQNKNKEIEELREEVRQLKENTATNSKSSYSRYEDEDDAYLPGWGKNLYGDGYTVYGDPIGNWGGGCSVDDD